MRKSIVALMAAGLTLSLAACGGDTETTAESSSEGSTMAPAEAGTLTIWADETRVEAFQSLGADFQAETGITLDVVQKPTGDIKTDFIAQAPTGEGPDLIVGAHDWTGDLISNGVIAPVELGSAAEGLAEVAARGFTNQGQLYGVPYATENIGLVRNNAIATDTPATFDELVAQGKELGAQYPVLIQQGDQGDAYHLYPIQTSFGAPVFTTDDNGDYTAELGMAGPEGDAFAAYLATLADEGVLSATIGGDQAKQAFLDGKSPYIVTGPWWTGEFVDAGLDITVLPVPSAGGQPAAPFVGVQGVFLSSQSENALLANQFLTWLVTPEAQQKLYEIGGRVPALTELADALDDPILAGFAEAGAEGQPMPAIPEMGAVWNFWGGAEISIINGQASDPADAWATMNQNIQDAF
ncbi:MAG: extracellular solute-binding protein [Arachnia sp.]